MIGVRAFRIFSGVNRLGASRRALSAVAASEKSPMAGAFMTLAKSRFNSRLSARRRLREPLGRGRVGWCVTSAVQDSCMASAAVWRSRSSSAVPMASAKHATACPAATAAFSSPLGQTRTPAIWVSYAKDPPANTRRPT